MPHTMPLAEQENKWFLVILVIALPFFVFFKILKKDLPAVY